MTSGIRLVLTDTNGNTRTIEDAAVGSSLMEVARENDVEGILADCGGASSCATCHVYVGEAWLETVGAPDEIEEAMLDMVEDVRRPTSRLSCQIRLSAALDGLEATVAPPF